MVPKFCKVRDLRLGDNIRLFDDGCYGDAVVTQITDSIVHVFRPYMATSDFSYTGGVIPYIGHETVQLFITGEREYLVHNIRYRKELK